MFDILSDVENVMIFYIYNEKNQKEDQKYTIKRKMIFLDIFEKAIICKEFNAHHSWWTSKIQNSIRAKKLISWMNRLNCRLINISDKMTYTLHSSILQFVLDLTFTTLKIAENIMD